MSNSPFMQDQEMMRDALSMEKLVTSNYNTFANECATPQLFNEVVNLLHEEHDIQNDVFNVMHSRGWYPTPAAEQQKIDEAKTKYNNMSL